MYMLVCWWSVNIADVAEYFASDRGIYCSLHKYTIKGIDKYTRVSVELCDTKYTPRSAYGIRICPKDSSLGIQQVLGARTLNGHRFQFGANAVRVESQHDPAALLADSYSSRFVFTLHTNGVHMALECHPATYQQNYWRHSLTYPSMQYIHSEPTPTNERPRA